MYMYITYTSRIHIHLQTSLTFPSDAITGVKQLQHSLSGRCRCWVMSLFHTMEIESCAIFVLLCSLQFKLRWQSGVVGWTFNFDTEVTFGLMKNEKACPLGDSSLWCSSLRWVKSILGIAGETKTSQTTSLDHPLSCKGQDDWNM